MVAIILPCSVHDTAFLQRIATVTVDSGASFEFFWNVATQKVIVYNVATRGYMQVSCLATIQESLQALLITDYLMCVERLCIITGHGTYMDEYPSRILYLSWLSLHRQDVDRIYNIDIHVDIGEFTAVGVDGEEYHPHD